MLLNPNNVQRLRKHDGMEYGWNRELNVESGDEMMGIGMTAYHGGFELKKQLICFIRLWSGRWVDFAYQNGKLILKEIIIIPERDGKGKEVL